MMNRIFASSVLALISFGLFVVLVGGYMMLIENSPLWLWVVNVVIIALLFVIYYRMTE